MTSAYGKQGGPKPGQAPLPLGAYSISHAAGFGFLYQITGDRKYAELGRRCFEWAFEGVRDRDREARYSFRQPGGALRAGPSLGWYALGYDLCYDGWDPTTRVKIAKAIRNYDEGKFMRLRDLARGARHMPASNHWGMQVGGAALALLAIRGDAGADDPEVEKMLDQNAKAMIRNLTEGFGDHGWFPEGDGTGSMASQIAFAPALHAWRTAGGKDFITPRPNAPWMTLKWIFLTVPRGGEMDFPKRGAYPHNVWARTSISGAGYFSEGFGSVTEAQKAGLLWFYDRHLREADEQAGTPFDTTSPYPHHAILSFVLWPFGLEARNPAEVLPRAVVDKTYGFYMFRNRWQDGNDIVISCQALSTRGWHKAASDASLWIWGLGRKKKWGFFTGKNTHFEATADGSAVAQVSTGTNLAVDFSRASGAPAMLVMTGPGAPNADRVEAGGTGYAFYFVTDGPKPEPRAEGDGVVIGDQRVSLHGGRLVLKVFGSR